MKYVGIYSSLILTGSMLLLTGCTDDKYDLSDIDTTTAIKLNNLVVPVNLESIYLDQVFKIDDDDPSNPLMVFTDNSGKRMFAIKIEGDFSADPVYLNELEAKSYASISSLPLTTNGNNINPGEVSYQYNIGAGEVDNSIERIYRMGLSKPMAINLEMNYANSNSIPEISNLVLIIPESFTATYHGSEFSNGEVPVTMVNGALDEPIYVYALDFGNGVEPTGSEGNKSLVFEGKLGIKSGMVSSTSSGLTANFSMSPFTADQISGAINYGIEAPEFEEVSLEGLPDFLREGDSKLIISNPQIYLNFGNQTGAQFFSQLNINPMGNGGNAVSIPMEPFVQSLILAANVNDLALRNDFPDAILQQDNTGGLQNVLYGEGLPERIDFSLTDTYLRGDVLNLSLGAEYQIYGNYAFFTPLAFEASSQIIYQDKETDFFGDDMEAVNVTQLQLSAYPTTNLPFEVELTVYPLDKDGNHIKDQNGNVVMASGIVEANANGSRLLDINLNQPFTGLDGVEYRVSAVVMNNESLSPDQFIKLDNIRARVTGEYVTKL